MAAEPRLGVVQGKHSTARLPAAVQEWLEAEAISYRQPTPGMLDIAV